MTSQAALRIETDQAVTVLTVNRPEQRNAIDDEVVRQFESALGAVEASQEVRALIVTGAGSTFIAGGDISMIQEHLDHAYRFFWMHDRITQLGQRLERLRVPVIAALNGAALGGGLELALACDFRIAAASARLGLPEVGLGIMPGSGGSARLARIVGREQALLMELTGRPVDAAEALRIGLVSQVVADGEALTAARTLALQIVRQPAAAVAFIKRAVGRALDMPLDGAVDYCQYVALSLGATADAREGLQAFLQKRPPRWRGE